MKTFKITNKAGDRDFGLWTAENESDAFGMLLRSIIADPMAYGFDSINEAEGFEFAAEEVEPDDDEIEFEENYLITVMNTNTRGPEDPVEQVECDTMEEMMKEFERLAKKHIKNGCSIEVLNPNIVY